MKGELKVQCIQDGTFLHLPGVFSHCTSEFRHGEEDLADDLHFFTWSSLEPCTLVIVSCWSRLFIAVEIIEFANLKARKSVQRFIVYLYYPSLAVLPIST